MVSGNPIMIYGNGSRSAKSTTSEACGPRLALADDASAVILRLVVRQQARSLAKVNVYNDLAKYSE